MQFRVIVVTDPHTNTHTHPQTGPITMHCAAASLVRSVIMHTAEPEVCRDVDIGFFYIALASFFHCLRRPFDTYTLTSFLDPSTDW